MTFLSLVATFLLEQVRPLNPRFTLFRLFAKYANNVGKHFNAGEARQGMVAWLLGVLPWVVAVALIYHVAASVSVVLAWVWNVAVLYVTMGFRQFSHGYNVIVEALRAGDLDAARKQLGEWRNQNADEYNGNEVAKVAIEEGLVEAHRHVFGVMFWFILLPGPAASTAGLLLCHSICVFGLVPHYGSDPRCHEHCPQSFAQARRQIRHQIRHCRHQRQVRHRRAIPRG